MKSMKCCPDATTDTDIATSCLRGNQGRCPEQVTVRLSPPKVSRIMRLLLGGLPQANIAERVRVNQASVSLYFSRFKIGASEVGILTAGKEYGVLDEMEGLRSLAVELYNSHLTTEEAKLGLKISKAFLKLGVSPSEHMALVNVCRAVANPAFIRSAIKLTEIEANTGISHEQTISRFEKASAELPGAERKLQQARSEEKSLSDAIAEKKKVMANLDHETQIRKAQLDTEIAGKMRQVRVKDAEVTEVSKLKAELTQKGLDIPTLIKLAKEV